MQWFNFWHWRTFSEMRYMFGWKMSTANMAAVMPQSNNCRVLLRQDRSSRWPQVTQGIWLKLSTKKTVVLLKYLSAKVSSEYASYSCKCRHLHWVGKNDLAWTFGYVQHCNVSVQHQWEICNSCSQNRTCLYSQTVGELCTPAWS